MHLRGVSKEVYDIAEGPFLALDCDRKLAAGKPATSYR